MEEEAAAAANGAAPSAESDATEKDDDERELDKLEKQDPEMLRVCTTIVDQLDNFKVRSIECFDVENRLTLCTACFFFFLTFILICLNV